MNLLFLSALVAATTVESLPLEPDGEVVVRNVSGMVQLRPWDKAEVRLRATVDDGVRGVQFERRGERVWIEVKLFEHHSRGQADLVVNIPRKATADVELINGRVEAEAGGKLRVHTVNADIAARAHGPKANLHTVNGRIDVQAESTTLEAELVKGRLQARIKHLNSSRIRAVSGVVDLRVETLASAPHHIDTQDADVRLDIARSQPVRVEVDGLRARESMGDPKGVPIQVRRLKGDVDLTRH